jgi:hypothetical protein
LSEPAVRGEQVAVGVAGDVVGDTGPFDRRDLTEIRVYHHDAFLCRAINPELADTTISLKDLTAAGPSPGTAPAPSV